MSTRLAADTSTPFRKREQGMRSTGNATHADENLHLRIHNSPTHAHPTDSVGDQGLENTSHPPFES
ncbi:hypothetical protein HMPREF9057_01641 [Actinomyces sp. oral taxon 171 str. F0337]|nr:hypothetical protein HMPREF9057_01641 [Actinomyces sp. oral taxon 171 str. F0337]